MPTATAEETLGEFFGIIALQGLIEKKILGGYQVPLGPVMMRVSPWIFQVGCVLGRALRNQTTVLVKMISMTADGPDPEKKVCDALCGLATDRLESYGGQPASLHDFWWKTEFNLDLSHTSLEELKDISRQRVPLEEVHGKLDEWLAWGMGFGATYPQLLEDLWAKTFGQVDVKAWEHARHCGLALRQEPSPLSLEDAERDILADMVTYTRKNFPELLDSLGLTERLSHA